MQERELTTDITKGITDFKASTKYLDNFMRGAGIQSSVRLHGCAGSTISNSQEELMNQIQEVP